VERAGSTSTPAHTLFEFVKRLADGAPVRLDLQGEDGRLVVSSGKSRLTLPVLPPGDFPSMPVDATGHRFLIAPNEFSRLIDKTKFAISTEETRYYLNGIYFHTVAANGGGVASAMLRGVATDGHRLALADSPAPEGSVGMPGVIIPRKTIQELRRLLDDAAGDVEVAVSTAKIRIQVGDAVLTSKLIDGAFPQYDRVIPTGNSRVLKVENRTFAAAVDRVSTVSAERSRSVKLAIDGEKVTLTVNNPDQGVATEDLPADYGSDPMEIGFNSRYLKDVSDQIEGIEAQFEFLDSGAPTLVRDPSDAHALYVLMPLRV
jgi:DNA polymerase-3 subunit beta